ncbi:MAG: dihydrodipicolinate reductase [Deltaproteobacteria bacterium]|nr:dihydrodipicolinate reductase [Deltaproteobacteria bacterium]
MSAANTRVVVVGAGPIGASIAVDVARRPELRLVAVVDLDPKKLGSEIAGVRVQGSVAEVDADVAVVCTTSSFVGIVPTLRACLARGLHVVSTCEQLVWPWHTHKELAAVVDDEARAAGKAIVGTGVNPGFLMDALPVFLTAISARVDSISVVRAQDASTRRIPFQNKIGIGLQMHEWNQSVAAGGFLHQGLQESAALIAQATGLTGTFKQWDSPSMDLNGQIDGVSQEVRVIDAAGVVRLSLVFEARLLHPNPRDEIVVEGEPGMKLITRGVHGDVATRAIAVNAIGAVVRAAPGLRSMLDLPLPVGQFSGGNAPVSQQA